MAYSKAQCKASMTYDKAHYKQIGVKMPLEVYEQMTKCKRNDCLAAKQNTCLYF